MPFSPDITELWSNFKNLVKKVSYDKTEVDDKLLDKSDINHTHIINDVSNLQSTLDNKAPSSHVHSKLVPTDILENADLNNYTTQGSFYCPLNATAVTVNNAPCTQAFHLEVYKTTSDSGHGVCQVAYSFHQDDVHTWWRNGYGGNWSEWYEVANKEDIASLNNNKANTNHTHSVVTTSTNGFMANTHKVKLDSIATGANKTVVDTALSSTSTNPVQNKVVNAQLTSLNNNKANIGHTHGKAYSATTLTNNTYCQVLGNIAIVSWWSGSVNISQVDTWVDLWTLPVTNRGKTVWNGNLHNGASGILYFRVDAGSNKVQALSSFVKGNLPYFPGQLVFFID